MKLFYSKTSPYSRKVRITLLEKRLDPQIEYVLCNPFDDAAELNRLNPLGKIPTLVLDDGRIVYDSRVICDYLESVDSHDAVTPATRLLIHRWEALADGIIDASYSVVMEGRRSENERSSSCIKRWQAQIVNSIKQVERQLNTLPGEVTIAQIAPGAALGYLDFRLNDIDWRSGHAETAAWYKSFSRRDSMIKTEPPV